MSRPNAPLCSSALGCWANFDFSPIPLYRFINPLTRSSQRSVNALQIYSPLPLPLPSPLPSVRACPNGSRFCREINTLSCLLSSEGPSAGDPDDGFMRDTEINVFADRCSALFHDSTRLLGLNAADAAKIRVHLCAGGCPQYFKLLENYHHVRKIKRVDGGRSKSVYREAFIVALLSRKRQMKIEVAVNFARRQMDPRAAPHAAPNISYVYERISRSLQPAGQFKLAPPPPCLR